MKLTFAWITSRPTLTVAAAAVFSLCALQGCDEPETSSNVTSTPPVQKSQATRQDTVDSAAEAHGPQGKITELSATEMLRRWEEAQQQVNFAEYEILYATRFDGIVEEQNVTFRFVRDQWLQRQEAVLKQQQQPLVQNETVHVLPGIATIQFQFSNQIKGTTETVDKTLVLVNEDNAIRIAREFTAAKTKRTRPEPKKKKREKLLNDFFLVLNDRYVVFQQSDLDKQDALFVNNSTAMKPVRSEEMKKKYRRLMKRKFIVGYKDGSTETMRITSGRAIARYGLHSGTRAHWVEAGYTEVQMGEALWELAAQSKSVYLTGVLQSSKKGALWATPVQPRPPEVYHTKKLNRAGINNIKKRMRRRDEYKVLQQAFVEAGHTKQWVSYEPQAFARVFRSPKGNRQFAAATITAGKGCGDFFGSLQGFYHVQKGVLYDLGYPTDFFQDPFIDNRDVIQAIDIDHDGIPEFLAQNKLMYKIDDDWFVYELRIPYADCPC